MDAKTTTILYLETKENGPFAIANGTRAYCLKIGTSIKSVVLGGLFLEEYDLKIGIPTPIKGSFFKIKDATWH